MSAKLQYLKQVMQTEPEPPKISDAFWDEVAHEPSFASAGRPAENPRLRAMMERVGRHVLGEAYSATSTMLIHVREDAFWHGCCVLDGKLAQILYFEDIDRGLLAIAGDIGSGTTYYVPFSSIETSGEIAPAVVRTVPPA